MSDDNTSTMVAAGVFVPPPPVGPGIAYTPAQRGRATPEAVASVVIDDMSEPAEGRRLDTEPTDNGGGFPFSAEMDVSELDDRDRPGASWGARARGLSRSALVMNSRRMCYLNRLLVIAVHLIDDEPVPLFGRVSGCEYDGDGLYRIEVELLPLPTRQPILDWIASCKKTRA